MALLAAHDLGLAAGGPPLLAGATFSIEKGDRIGLVGRNGAGKSTLLAALAGLRPPDAGTLDRQAGLRVGLLPQEVPQDLAGTVAEAVAAGVDLHVGEENWGRDRRVARALTRLGLPADRPVAALSGGMRRRVLLARALAAEPDVLLLDEPTNHLDIETIRWLEDVLAREVPTLVVVTHDRALLRALCTRVLELDRGRLIDFAGGWDGFVEHRDELLHAESQAWQRQDRRLAQEEAWLRQGLKARRTRNEGRLRALEQLRAQRRQRRPRPGAVRLELAAAERGGRLVVRAEDVAFGFGERPVIAGFSTTILRGDRVGIIGPNGAGKTTLLELLLGRRAPQSGTLRLGAGVQAVHVDQLRQQLDPERSVRENLGIDRDEVTVGGRTRHVTGYLQDFLFSPERARSPVRALSGGERNRLLLARLFAQEANLLALDEPTNDLDLDTLDLLEDLLAEFPGTLLLVSHDRTLLDRVVTSVLALPGDGTVQEAVGGYTDWLAQQAGPSRPQPPVAREAAARRAAREPGPGAPPPGAAAAAARPRKLSYRERRELDELPATIERLEALQAELHARLGDPALYRDAPAEVTPLTARLAQVKADLARAYARWEELEPFA